MKVGTSIGKIGFIGDCYLKLRCLTNNWTQDHADYFIHCHCSGGKNLWVIGGTTLCTVGYSPVRLHGIWIFDRVPRSHLGRRRSHERGEECCENARGSRRDIRVDGWRGWPVGLQAPLSSSLRETA